ncbi:IDEAL domain-containing protein [Lysinibacillus sp. KU-BSD001]|uniref:IDEAL domain-containing protein n=1 Tax=Lysinibacillus sp. KU-BSD001 TaxID=3141328 RepID=UPI0036EDB5EF
MDSFIDQYVSMFRAIAFYYHGYKLEEGILLASNTIKLVTELEEINRQRLIEQALVNGDKELFMELTTKKR